MLMTLIATLLFALAAMMVLQVAGAILAEDGRRILRLLAIGVGGVQPAVAVRR